MLLQRFVTEKTVDHFIHRVAETMKGETQISVRCYMEVRRKPNYFWFSVTDDGGIVVYGKTLLGIP